MLAERGVCDLIYGDESGFSLVPTVPYLWQKIAERVELASPSHRLRCNVIGFWKAPGLEKQKMMHWETLGYVDGPEFVRAVEARLLPSLRRRTVLVLDNAPHHHGPAVRAKLQEWRQLGLHVWFLPTYCPHLNHIEHLWKAIKHRWLSFEAFLNMKKLKFSLSHILDLVGHVYQISFG